MFAAVGKSVLSQPDFEGLLLAPTGLHFYIGAPKGKNPIRFRGAHQVSKSRTAARTVNQESSNHPVIGLFAQSGDSRWKVKSRVARVSHDSFWRPRN